MIYIITPVCIVVNLQFHNSRPTVIPLQYLHYNTRISSFILYLISFLGAFAKFRKATISFVMSVCLSAWNNSAPTRQILMKLDI
jgi:hypothetical protein